MKNIVTFETAQRLKEAGFPQPEPERGQVWYNDTGANYLITNTGGVGVYYACGPVLYTDRSLSADSCVFAPTATDILFYLSSDYEIYRSAVRDLFAAVYKDESGEVKLSSYNSNPAEAAAALWLERQKNKA